MTLVMIVMAIIVSTYVLAMTSKKKESGITATKMLDILKNLDPNTGGLIRRRRRESGRN